MLRQGPKKPEVVVVLAHGAGAGMDTPFMNTVAAGVAEAEIGVLRFEFPYMQRIRAEGKRRPPDRLPRLQEAYLKVIGDLPDRKIVLGGKSMGGRVASTIADRSGASGLVCMGYPFHPPAKPDALRTAHLADLKTPCIILQGSRDPFGNRDEVACYDLSPAIRTIWLEDGDHSFKPRKASGHTLEEHIQTTVDEIVAFCLLI